MLAEYRQRILLVVLRADSQRYATPAQAEQVLVKRAVGFALRIAAQPDAVEPVLADDAAPQGAIEIEDGALGGEPADGSHQGSEAARELRHGVGRRVLLGSDPHPRIAPAPLAGRRRQVLDVEHRDAGLLSNIPELEIQPLNDTRAATRRRRTQPAERIDFGYLEVHLDDRRSVPLLARAPKRRHAIDQTPHRVRGVGGFVRQPERAPVDGEHDDLRTEIREWRYGIKNFQLIWVVLAGQHLALETIRELCITDQHGQEI